MYAVGKDIFISGSVSKYTWLASAAIASSGISQSGVNDFKIDNGTSLLVFIVATHISLFTKV